MKKIKNIMIIDDDELNNYITTKIIEHAKIADNVKCYQSARKALAYLQANSYKEDGEAPEVILLDISMYDMNGWEFLEQYENINPAYRDQIQLFILTTSVFEQDIVKAKKFKCVQDFFIKPLTMTTLDTVTGSLKKPKNDLVKKIKVLLNISF